MAVFGVSSRELSSVWVVGGWTEDKCVSLLAVVVLNEAGSARVMLTGSNRCLSFRPMTCPYGS